MNIQINRQGQIDLETPIFMTPSQFREFRDGLREIFDVIKIHNVKELDKEMTEIERHAKKWKPDELVYLLTDKSHEEVARILNREPFSVKSKRGVWLLSFYTWANKKGYVHNGHLENIKELLMEYESERE